MEIRSDEVADAVTTLKQDIAELESHFTNWNSRSAAGARCLRSIARRIVLSGKRLETLVKETTYSP